ncbi:hypothetical protein [Marinilabilia salmonicolor]|uniref:hypothetical protein n=1 Tax=Marinilabilia salmonicolor TaxID=989 RepID=UPI00029A25AD|nr:hypothetical protein [Marinilabilia salmonicolor]
MLSLEPNIFFVDDKRNEVEEIVEIYRNQGYGVKFFNADLTFGDDVPRPNTYKDAILVFLDIYYTPDRILDEEKCSEWINGIVNQNSFFILVIWSQDTDEAGKVINKIMENNRFPFVTIIKQKSDYQDGENHWDFKKLHADIQYKLDERPELIELASWKRSIKEASNLIIGHLAKNENPDDFTKRLQKIILGHGGRSMISEKELTGKQEVLFDALDSVLISNSKNTRPNIEIIKKNIDALYKIEEGLNSEIDSKLNSWFHFKFHPQPIDQSKITPGLISKILSEDVVKEYGLLDDKNVKEFLKVQIENQQTKIEDICLLLTRPCDIAQNKFGKNLKLLSGVKISNPVRKDNARKEFKTGHKYDSIKLYDHLCFAEEDNDVALLFDYRYSFSISKEKFINDFDKVNTFNKDLLSEIQVEYSAYSSRLGITQII